MAIIRKLCLNYYRPSKLENNGNHEEIKLPKSIYELAWLYLWETRNTSMCFVASKTYNCLDQDLQEWSLLIIILDYTHKLKLLMQN